MKEPKQRRSQETLGRLRAAGLRLIDRVGPDSLTVQEVAKAARSSVGSFYQRFSGKEDFLVHLWTHENGSAIQAWERRLTQVRVDREGMVCELASLLREAESSRAGALRSLRDYLDRSDLLPDNVEAFADRVADLVLGALTARARGLGIAEPDVPARLVATALFLRAEAMTVPRSPYAALLADLDCGALERMLEQAARAGTRGPAVDPFDVWSDPGTQLPRKDRPDADAPRGMGADA